MLNTHSRLIFAGAIAALMMAPSASAQVITFKAEINGASEVPPTDSTGTDAAQVTVDTSTKKLSWMVTYTGLTGDAKAAHFHGPAAPGENAKPVVNISDKIQSGSADLTDQQLADLKSGKWYINIHTAKFPNGGIRGQVEKTQ